MKNILIAIIILFASQIFVGCKKVIKEVPYSFLTPENFPSTPSEADVALYGAYNPMQEKALFAYTGTYIFNAQNDVMVGGGWVAFNAATYASTNSVWQYMWQGINAANYLISSLENLDASKNPWTEVKIAEGKSIRALYYFWLVRYWGDLPLRLKPTTETVLKMQRSPAQAIYDSIILPDLQFADNKLPEIAAGGRFTLGAVKSLLGEVYITLAGWRRSSQGQMVAGDPKYWAKARDKFKEVLDLEAKGIYILEPSYSKLWTDNSKNIKNKEYILDVEFGPDKGSTFPYMYSTSPNGPANGGGNGNYSAQLDWLRHQDNRDERYQWNVGEFKYINGWDKFPVTDSSQFKMMKYKKIYPSTAYWEDHLTNWPLFRLGEIKLLYAEAANEAGGGPTPEAYAQINQIRYRARPEDHKTDGTILPDLVNLTQAQFRDTIMFERSNEMILEGKRKLSLVRWGKLEEKVALSNSNVRDNGLDAKFYLWNLPTVDLTLNGWEQNAGF